VKSYYVKRVKEVEDKYRSGASSVAGQPSQKKESDVSQTLVAELEEERNMLAKRLHVSQQRIIELQKQVDHLQTAPAA